MQPRLNAPSRTPANQFFFLFSLCLIGTAAKKSASSLAKNFSRLAISPLSPSYVTRAVRETSARGDLLLNTPFWVYGPNRFCAVPAWPCPWMVHITCMETLKDSPYPHALFILTCVLQTLCCCCGIPARICCEPSGASDALGWEWPGLANLWPSDEPGLGSGCLGYDVKKNRFFGPCILCQLTANCVYIMAVFSVFHSCTQC